ncbi:MAG: pyruvate ferredoxin oxidoreductase [Rhodobacteraceae bacterium]|nr:pyruvate ferredoxin oxidoreductase [Paracoccaceae bacterium]
MNAPAFNENLHLLNGNHAVAWGVRLAKPDVAPLYPITPQTPILEKLIDFQSKNEFDAELLTPESEHSAMAAAIAASATGARVFTATSSQGLLLMHELLHYASGARTPMVLFNVNRTPGAPWGFWPDQIDSLSQRDTGWIQFYSENPQESLDTVIQAFRISEAANLPVMINHDAFYVSHSIEPVNLPSAEVVDGFLPRIPREFQLGDDSGRSLGAPLDQAGWNLTRQDMDVAMQGVERLTAAAGGDWAKLTGRPAAPLELYRCEDAEVVFVTMGSMCGNAREAVDRLRENGIAAGLLKVRLFRPLPAEALREALAGVPCAIVLDRNYSPGTGGVLHQELKAVLFGIETPPRLHGMLAGVGGVNVPVETIEKLAAEYRNAAPSAQPIWVE